MDRQIHPAFEGWLKMENVKALEQALKKYKKVIEKAKEVKEKLEEEKEKKA